MFWKKEKSEEKQIFFVRGFQRSGTNWVSNLLNLHPNISCIGEFHLKQFFHAYKHMLERKHGLIKQNPDFFHSNFEQFVSQLVKHYNSSNALYVGDRTPMALQDLILPNNKYILICRDGRDILISWIYHLFRIDHSFGKQMESKKEIYKSDNNYFENNKNELLNNHWVEKIARNWNTRILQDNDIKVNQKKHNILVHSLKYETLLKDTETERMCLYNFLGAEDHKAKELTDLTSPGFEEHKPDSHYRKGEAGRWKQYFSEEQLHIFESHAISALKLLGYEIYTHE